MDRKQAQKLKITAMKMRTFRKTEEVTRIVKIRNMKIRRKAGIGTGIKTNSRNANELV